MRGVGTYAKDGLHHHKNAASGPGRVCHLHLPHIGGPPQDLRLGNGIGIGVADAGVYGVVFVRRLLHRIEVLHVLGHDDTGHGTLGQGNAAGAVDQMAHLHGISTGLHVLAGHIFEQIHQVNFLLVAAAQGGTGGLPGNGQHRLVIHLGVIQAIEEVDGAGSGGGHTDTQLAGKFGVARGHEGRRLFMAHLDEVEQLEYDTKKVHFIFLRGEGAWSR
jgi:hypothetical protein